MKNDISLKYYLLILLMVLHQFSFTQQKSSIQNPVDPASIHINWDSTTLRHVANGGYARMIELKDHSLITIYAASNGNTEIVRSNDNGNTWSTPMVVAAKSNNIRMDAPDILLLYDGSLLACYNPRPSHNNTDTSKHFAIRIAKSYDNGLTWKDDKLLYTASYLFKDGCWEPSAMQLPSGEIQLFFSNENVYRESDEQNISLFRSFDNGKSWTNKPLIVSYRKGSRDGMPVPVYLSSSKELLFSIEDNGFTNFKPYVIRSPVKDNWHKTVGAGSNQRNYALKDSLQNNLYAGAPYLRLLSNGNTILSYQSTQFRQGKNDVNNAEMVVMIGDDEGRNFTNATVPFKTPANATTLWNSICVLKDNTVVALTSTNMNGRPEVFMIKGKITIEK